MVIGIQVFAGQIDDSAKLIWTLMKFPGTEFLLTQPKARARFHVPEHDPIGLPVLAPNQWPFRVPV